MKSTLKIIIFALLSIAMMACGEKKITQDDLKKAEATLFNENQTMNEDAAPGVAETYEKFVEQSPDDPTAPTWLFHAMELNLHLKDFDKSIALGNQLLEQYPESKWAPRTLFLLGNYVYDEQLHDLDKAREAYERIINDYPDSGFVEDAQKSIEYLGMTPEEIMSKIMMSNMEVVEGEF